MHALNLATLTAHAGLRFVLTFTREVYMSALDEVPYSTFIALILFYPTDSTALSLMQSPSLSPFF